MDEIDDRAPSIRVRPERSPELVQHEGSRIAVQWPEDERETGSQTAIGAREGPFYGRGASILQRLCTLKRHFAIHLAGDGAKSVS